MAAKRTPAPLPFSLQYYSGDPEPVKLPSGFPSIVEAAGWAAKNGLPYSTLSVTEYDLDSVPDAYGLYDRVGSCNLDEAVEGGYTDLNF